MPAGYRESVSCTGSPWSALYICRRLLIPALGGPYSKLTSEALKETRERNISNSCRQKNTTSWHLFVILVYLAQMPLCRFSALLNIYSRHYVLQTLRRKWPDLIIYSRFDTECSLSQQQTTAGCFALWWISYMWIKLSKWSTWQNYVNGVLEMEQFPFESLMTDFPVKWTAGAFVLFIDSNPSFAALNLAEDRAQLSINSSNKPSDTSITHQSGTLFFCFFSR